MIKLTFFLLALAMSVLSGQGEAPNQPAPQEDQPDLEAQPQPQPQEPKTDPQPVLIRVSQESRQPKLEENPGTPSVTPSVTPEGKGDGFFYKVISFFRRIASASALPWCIAILMAGLTGASGAWIVMLRKQGMHFKLLRQKVIDGTEPVFLLPAEATRLIHEFKELVTDGGRYFDESVKDQRAEVKRIVHEAESSSRASRDETLRTVDTFKTSLNGMLGSLTKFMDRVVQDTDKTHNQALETKEYAKNVAELIHAKEREITRLKEGYDLHLITPLTKAFLRIRDDLHAMTPHIADNQIRSQLGDLDHKIVAALGDLRIKEIEIPEDLKNFTSQKWESLGAADATDDPARHGKRARIKEKGYQLEMPDAEPHIIRKAVVVVYSCQTLTDAGEQQVTTNIESEDANHMAASPSTEHPRN
jgi:hypothetical protein